MKSNQTILKKKFNTNLSSENKSLPRINWPPKLLKERTESRFIIAAPKYSAKTLSKALTSMLSLLLKPINACNDKCTFLIWCENLLGSFKHSPCNRFNQNTKIILIREKKQNQSRSSQGKCSVKNVLFEISQNSQENTCAKVFFLIKLLAAPT